MRTLFEEETWSLSLPDGDKPLTERARGALLEKWSRPGFGRMDRFRSQPFLAPFNPLVEGRACGPGTGDAGASNDAADPARASLRAYDLLPDVGEGERVPKDAAAGTVTAPGDCDEGTLRFLLFLLDHFPDADGLAEMEDWNGAPFRLVVKAEDLEASGFTAKDALEEARRAMALVLRLRTSDGPLEGRPVTSAAPDGDGLALEVDFCALAGLLGFQTLPDRVLDGWELFDPKDRSLPGLLCLYTAMNVELLPADEDEDGDGGVADYSGKTLRVLMDAENAPSFDASSLMAALGRHPDWKVVPYEEIADGGGESPFTRGERLWRVERRG